MVFTSTIFMFVFLPITIGCYFLVKKELRNAVLLIASLLFYAWGEPKHFYVMLLSIAINYTFGMLIYKNNERLKKKKVFLTLAVVCNLGLLILFKYSNFFVDNINDLFNLLGVKYVIKIGKVHMPIGISFFTFQGLSYVIDVYRNTTGVQRSIFDLALFKSLFPQLIAGPIVRYHDVEHEIDNRKVTVDKVYYGFKRFIIGFGKKMLIANQMGEIADKVFAIPMHQLTTAVAWLGILCYTLQIYYDFSGYSDMAIGLGRVFGFTFLENFNYPYISKSIKEFWARWHISLTNWFRDYVYFPLGGSRVSKAKAYRNQMIVFLLSGFWHGASWNFIFWGAYNGAFLILERTKLYSKLLNKLWSPLKHVYAILVIMIGWVFFRADNLMLALRYLKRMFILTGTNNYYYTSMYMNNRVILTLIAAIILSAPIIGKIKGLVERKAKNKFYYELGGNLILIFILVLSIIRLSSTTYNPFIYFRF